MEKLSDDEQDEIVGEIAEGLGILSEEEFDALYEQLDSGHQMQVRDTVREYVDDAVGDEHWDSDR